MTSEADRNEMGERLILSKIPPTELKAGQPNLWEKAGPWSCLTVQEAQERQSFLEDPSETRFRALMRAMELQRAENVKQIMND